MYSVGTKMIHKHQGECVICKPPTDGFQPKEDDTLVYIRPTPPRSDHLLPVLVDMDELTPVPNAG